MDKKLVSVGLDVGTTTTQLIVSELTAKNRASSFAVPQMEITARQIRYQSPVHFTPLLSGELVDREGLRSIVRAEYEAAGIRPEDVDTGAVIITGETSRKQNAEAVLRSLSDFAGDFVVATAGPDLESVLAAKGAGAVEYSEESGKAVLHIDIGGGTANMALCEGGKITATGCMNVGGRLLKFDEAGRITYVSPVLLAHIPHREGDTLTQAQAMVVARLLASALEMAAGLAPKTELFDSLTTAGTAAVPEKAGATLSFSGGVADCIEKDIPWLAYGDLGPLLGRAIRESALCRGSYRLGSATIRATVIGAGCHSVQLSGSTVYLQNAQLPIKNLPVAVLTRQEQEEEGLSHRLRTRLEALEQWGAVYLPGWENASYRRITALADAIVPAVGRQPCYICTGCDMAKALGHALALRLGPEAELVCIDSVAVPEQSYLDLGERVGPAITVAVKTLIFEK